METATKNRITLKGSADIVCEYLDYGVNNILFQRGIYGPETFKHVQMYGMTLLMSEDEKIKSFISTVMKQVHEWLLRGNVSQISLIIKNVRSNEVLECWDFKIECEEGDVRTDDDSKKFSTKELKRIRIEISAIMRQIAATISYLPLLDCVCSFDLLIHTPIDCTIPDEWSPLEPVFIHNSHNVKLNTFSTGLHKMDTIVSYKRDENEF